MSEQEILNAIVSIGIIASILISIWLFKNYALDFMEKVFTAFCVAIFAVINLQLILLLNVSTPLADLLNQTTADGGGGGHSRLRLCRIICALVEYGWLLMFL